MKNQQLAYQGKERQEKESQAKLSRRFAQRHYVWVRQLILSDYSVFER